MDFVEGGVLNFKEQGFSNSGFFLSCLSRGVRYLWSNSVTNCDIRIWHTLAEVELFVFLFLIKLFLNCCCSIDVLYCSFILLIYFAICFLSIKACIFICCRQCLPT